MPSNQSSWVASWIVPVRSVDHVGGPRPTYDDATIRVVLRPVFSGPRARVRLSNLFGTAPVAFHDVSVARSIEGAAVDPTSRRPVRFAGSSSIEVPPGQLVTSDPIDFTVDTEADLAVSFFVPGASGPAAGHTPAGPSHGMLHVAVGNHADDDGGEAFGPPVPGSSFLVELDVDAPNDGALVVLGDSITEGSSSDRAWSEVLAGRIRTSVAAPRISVVNAGVGGDAICKLLPTRLQDDVLRVTGVVGVVLMVGINDIGGGRELRVPPPAEAVITGIDDVAGELAAAGLTVWVSPLPPSGDAGRPSMHVPHYSDPDRIEKRQAINAWIRASRWYDPRIDFEHALMDPANPQWIPEALSADNLHPGTAGQAVMAASIDLGVFDRLVGAS